MSRPHIICAVTTDLTYDQRMQRICAALVHGGYRVTLVGRERPGSEPLVERAYAQYRLRCRHHAGKAFYLEYNWRLYRYLRHQSCDILCAVDLDTIVAVTHAAAGRPVVYDAHEYFSETPEVQRRPFIKRAWEGVARRYIPRCAAAYTVGPELARLLTARYGLPFVVVRNAARYVPEPVFLETQTASKYILYQGALNEGRGLPELITAMTQLPDLQLYLAGEGDLSEAIRRQVARLGLGERVQFLGYVAPHKLKALTRGAWLGYNLLEDRGLSYHYSLANKAFDYYQAGLPALHSDLPEYRALHRQYDGIILCDSLLPSSIAHHVRRLLREPEAYAALQRACQRARPLLAWRHEVGRLLAVYAEVSSSSK